MKTKNEPGQARLPTLLPHFDDRGYPGRRALSCRRLVSAGLLAIAPFLSATEKPPESWQVVSGTATVSENVFHLHAGKPPAELARFLSADELPGGTVTVRFWILPVADPSDSPLSTINVLGARLGFVAENGAGRIYVLDGEESVPTRFVFDILPTGEALDGFGISIEHQNLYQEEAVWTLAVDGVELGRHLGTDPLAAEAGLIQLFGDTYADVFLEEAMVVQVSGRLAENTADGGDPAPDHAVDSAARQKKELIAGSPSSPVSPASVPPLPDEGSAEPTGNLIYLCAATGNDRLDGRSGSPLPDRLSGPKRSMRAAIAAVKDGGTIVVAEGRYPQGLSGMKSHGKTLRIIPNGRVQWY